ncbi:MAG: putative membrane protein [Kiritimatiellia bacterium]|jgi:putative membrane protein
MSDNDASSNPRYYWLLLFFKGIAMGAADVVPGVSGGTIAFITGIYERLLKALTMLHPLTLRVIVKQGFAVFWQVIDGRFLFTLFAGIIVSILSLAKLINYALDSYPIAVWSFFFGLVVSSVIYLIRQTPQWRWQEFIAIALGAGIAISIAVLRPAQLPDTWWMMMLSGFIAICAMILPGISGSFILLLMGMYSVFIQALTELNLLLLASFAVGCVLGLIVFSHILSCLLRHYLSTMLALLTGFLLGSLSVLWPWKQVLETSLDRHGETIALVQTNISPMAYATLTNTNAQLSTAILTACVGFLIVFLLDRLSIKQ